MSLIYTVNEYESSVSSIVHFVFLAFPLSKVMSLIWHMLWMDMSHLSVALFPFFLCFPPCKAENSEYVVTVRMCLCLAGYSDPLHLRLHVCRTCQRTHWQIHRSQCSMAPEPVGCPFILSLPRSHCTYSRIARLMESFARSVVYWCDIFQIGLASVRWQKWFTETSQIITVTGQIHGHRYYY